MRVLLSPDTFACIPMKLSWYRPLRKLTIELNNRDKVAARNGEKGLFLQIAILWDGPRLEILRYGGSKPEDVYRLAGIDDPPREE